MRSLHSNVLFLEMTLVSWFLCVCLCILVVLDPLALGALFCVSLILASCIAGSLNRFVGLILFVVYVGGALVLFSYCLILTPHQKGIHISPLFLTPLVVTSRCACTLPGRMLSEFYRVAGLVLRVGFLLLLVIVSVVSMVDCSSGSIRVE